MRRLAYDPVADLTIAVGFGAGSTEQTWAFDGASWTLLDADSPTGGCSGLVWHAQRQRVIWFGFAGLFELIGNTWQPIANGGAPVPVGVNQFDVVYDASRDVLAAMQRSGGPVGATWEWNAATGWQQVAIPSPLPAQARFSFDPPRDRYVALTPSASGWSDDVWERAPGCAGAWELHAQSPHSTGNAPIVWDPAGARLLMLTWSPFGGMLGYSGVYPALYHEHGAGCGGGALQPMGPQDLPYAGSVFFADVYGTNSPLGLLVTGLDDQMAGGAPLPLPLDGLGMDGCMLRVSPDLLTVMTPAGPSLLRAGVQLGSAPASLGFEFFQQALVFVPGANPFGALMTSSMRGVKGRP